MSFSAEQEDFTEMDDLHRKRSVLGKKKYWFSKCKYQNRNQVALFEYKCFISGIFQLKTNREGPSKGQ